MPPSPFSPLSPFAEPGSSGQAASMPLARIATIGPVHDGLATEAAALGCGIDSLSVEAFTGGAPFRQGLLWIDTAAAGDTLPAMIARVVEEAIPTILVSDMAHIDAAFAAADGAEEVTLLVDPTPGCIARAIAQTQARGSMMLHSSVADARTDEIVALQDEVARISRMLARLSRDDIQPDHPPSPFIEDHVAAPRRGFHGEESARSAPISARDVRLVIRQRRLRDELFDAELFADPAWDMMLDLYAAKLERHRVAVSSLCIAAAVPATTALRWIKSLSDQGLFERHDDPHDGRRIFVALSDRATQAMHRYFSRLSDPQLAM
jgi:hypothetical protein